MSMMDNPRHDTSPQQDTMESNHGSKEDILAPFEDKAAENLVAPTPTDRDAPFELDQSPHTSQYLAPLVNEQLKTTGVESIEQQPLHGGFVPLDGLPRLEALTIPNIPTDPPGAADSLPFYISDDQASTEITEVTQAPIVLLLPTPGETHLPLATDRSPPPTAPHTESSVSGPQSFSPTNDMQQFIAYPDDGGVSDPNVQSEGYAYGKYTFFYYRIRTTYIHRFNSICISLWSLG